VSPEATTDYKSLASDPKHYVGVYLAAAEAIRHTRRVVTVTTDDHRWRLDIAGKTVRVFARATAQERPMRRATQQDDSDAVAVVYVDLSTDVPLFYVTPPGTQRGEVENWRDRWDVLTKQLV